MNTRTLCLILHYGSINFTINCVKSILEDDLSDIIIIDNEVERTIFPDDFFCTRVKYFKTKGNQSFAAANNLAVAEHLNSGYGTILLVNNDTIVLNDSIRVLRDTLADSGIGVVGPCMPYASNPNEIWACGGVIKKSSLYISGIRYVKNSFIHDVDYLPGAAIMCTPVMWNKVGGLPEKYHLAYEEAQFCLEIKKIGKRVVVNPSAQILHFVGMSSVFSPKYIYNSFRNKIRFSQYLYGDKFGLFFAICRTFFNIRDRSLTKAILKFRLWFRAVKDEFNNIPLTAAELAIIESQYVLDTED